MVFWLAATGVVFLAASATSLTGFGFALVLVPLMSIFWDVKFAVASAAILGTLSSLAMSVEARGHVNRSRVALMACGMCGGLPLGLRLLATADSSQLKVAIGAVVILFALLLWKGAGVRFKREGVPLVAAGFLSGLLQGSLSMGGPPVVLLLVSQDVDRHSFRGTLLAYFIPAGVATVALFALMGMVTPTVVAANLAFLPAMALGLWAGRRALPRVSQPVFRAVVLALVVLAGLGAIYSGAASLR